MARRVKSHKRKSQGQCLKMNWSSIFIKNFSILWFNSSTNVMWAFIHYRSRLGFISEICHHNNAIGWFLIYNRGCFHHYSLLSVNWVYTDVFRESFDRSLFTDTSKTTFTWKCRLFMAFTVSKRLRKCVMKEPPAFISLW